MGDFVVSTGFFFCVNAVSTGVELLTVCKVLAVTILFKVVQGE